MVSRGTRGSLASIHASGVTSSRFLIEWLEENEVNEVSEC